ncbi:hypothetical protein ND748_06035 [Frankia sp. AiPs1]|uniref:hypothetical protein n=1 Tax=Frankia sp. AiPs1 TaxID=573493 RepID=UPI002044ACFA|nr:hypothetical protein [Frankia sp. AiPs1]MCM3921236.1 hypothetical protein [Frankia sp. AiPs1]
MPNHINRTNIEQTVDLLVGRLIARLRTELGIDLTLGPRARARLLVELTAEQHLDGHSIGSALEDMLIAPRHQALNTHSPAPSGTLTITDVAREYGAWTVSLRH